MFDLCLFDLDETLLRTDDIVDIREACKNNSNPLTIAAVRNGLNGFPGRYIYSPYALSIVRAEFPDMSIGVFTRSPRSYAQEVLKWAYPGFKWDVLVAFEDVNLTKPNGEGIDIARERLGLEKDSKAILVGDGSVDVRAAYNANCFVALEKSSWSKRWSNENWRAIKYIPDAILEDVGQLLDVLRNPISFLPDLERRMAGDESYENSRFEKISHLIPLNFGGGARQIYVCGRYFSDSDSLKRRRAEHALTLSIQDNKNSESFPTEWLAAIRRFIRLQICEKFSPMRKVVVTTVPSRPERRDRLGVLLGDLKDYLNDNPINLVKVEFDSKLLSYRNGVRSQHLEGLDRLERFSNVKDHLEVVGKIAGDVTYIVLDDVVTTGASLIYSSEYLYNAGASQVICLGLSKNISDVLKYD